MLKVRMTVSDVQFEVEVGSKQELEDALEAALNVATRRRSPLLAHPREFQTPPGDKGLPSGLPPQANPPAGGGDTPPPIEEETREEAVIEALKQDEVVEETQTVDKAEEIGKPEEVETTSLYESANRLAEFGVIALAELGKRRGTNRAYSTLEILDFLRQTGGDVKLKGQASPVGALAQALRRSDEVVRKGSDNRLKEWLNQESEENEAVGAASF